MGRFQIAVFLSGFCLLLAGCQPANQPALPDSLAGPDPETVTLTGIQAVRDLPDAIPGQPPGSDVWNTWRGPSGTGRASAQNPPVEWDEQTGVVWKTPVPGRGHASPMIHRGRVYLPTAEAGQQQRSLCCFDEASGELLWETVVHQDVATEEIHHQNSHASSSAAITEDGVFVLFVVDEQLWLSKLDPDGKLIWQKDIGPFVSDHRYGFGTSPVVWQDRLFVAADSSDVGFLVALDPGDGHEIWRTDRPEGTSYSTPVVLNAAGKDQLLVSGRWTIKSYDPATGKELWSAPADWSTSCGTMVTDGDRVFASGGFPAAATIAVKGDGSAEIAWKNGVRCYEQSMLAHDGYLYALADNGVAYCWRAADGQEMWKKRMQSRVSASPVLADDRIYFTTQSGSTFVVRASPDRYELLATNQLGDSVLATPAFVNNRIYTRIGMGQGGDRQEWLYCLGHQPAAD